MTIACAGAKVNVVGLGATGLSLVRFLRAHGASVSVFDANPNASGRDLLQREHPEVAFSAIDMAQDKLPASDWIALSPGVPRATNVIADELMRGKKVIGDIELFASFYKGNAPIISITGSNGKTTTAQLTGYITEKAGIDTCVAGNVGLPVLDAMMTKPDVGAWVLEVSSFQLESTQSLRSDIATVLNVSANHLDRYSSFFGYAASKERIFDHAKQQVINRDDVWSSSMRRFNLPSVSFGASQPMHDAAFGLVNNDRGGITIAKGDLSLVDTRDLRLRGSHNVMNAMAALALTDSLQLAPAKVYEAITSFSGVSHRYEWLGQVDGVDVINDSKATTVVATCAALQSTSGPVLLIAGGDGKGQAFEDLATAAATSCRSVHVIGQDANAICAALAARGVKHQKFSSLDDAVVAALDLSLAGDTLLLSPACASWDMFRNFEHRAECFSNVVNAWAQSRGKTLSKERRDV